MDIRKNPEYIQFLEALITFTNVFPVDNVLYSIMLNSLGIPEPFQLYIKQTYGNGTRAAWIRMFEWALDTYPFLEVKERLHDAMQSAGLILRYRTFIRDYHLFVLRPEGDGSSTSTCCPFLC